MSRLFLVFKKLSIFFPVSNEYFFTNIKFYYCISTLVHGSKSRKRGQAPSTKKHLGKSIEERPEEAIIVPVLEIGESILFWVERQ